MKSVPKIYQGLLLTVLGFGQAQAIIINEIGDTGNTIPTAQQIQAGDILIDTPLTGPFALGTTIVNGSIESSQDTDLYGFNLINDAIVTFEAIFPKQDANLLVFNSLGQGLAGNDDFVELDEDGLGCYLFSSSLSELDSCLTLQLEAGQYYVGVGDNNIAGFESIEAFDTQETNLVTRSLRPDSATDFLNNDEGILEEPTEERLGLIAQEAGPTEFNDIGPYTLNIAITSDIFGFSSNASVPEAKALPLLGLGLILLAMLRRRSCLNINKLTV